MTLELLPAISSLPIAEVAVGSDRLRGISEAEVVALVDLVGEFGQTTPILVRRTKAGFVLVDGLHRLEAARRAGMTEIPVRAYRMTDDEAKMLEASQNLVGGLSPLDDAIFLAAWKRAHLKKHPETARGVAGALAHHGVQATSSSFAEIVAAKRAITPRQVQRIIAAGTSLDPESITRLRSCEHAVTLKDVEQLGKIGDPEERRAVVHRLAAGNAKSVAEARRSLRAESGEASMPPEPPVEAQFKALSTLWSRTGAVARRRFADDHREALLALLEDGGAEG